MHILCNTEFSELAGKYPVEAVGRKLLIERGRLDGSTLWMAFANGGGLILGGTWMRRD